MQDVEFSSQEIQEQMTNLHDKFVANPTIVGSTVRSWYEGFKASNSGELIPEDEFYPRLGDWLRQSSLTGGGSNFVKDIVLKPNSTGIVSCRFTGNHVQTDKSDTLVSLQPS